MITSKILRFDYVYVNVVLYRQSLIKKIIYSSQLTKTISADVWDYKVKCHWYSAGWTFVSVPRLKSWVSQTEIHYRCDMTMHGHTAGSHK